MSIILYIYISFTLYLFFLNAFVSSFLKHLKLLLSRESDTLFQCFFRKRKMLVCASNRSRSLFCIAVCYILSESSGKYIYFHQVCRQLCNDKALWMLQLVHTCVISNNWSVHIFCAGETLITQYKGDHRSLQRSYLQKINSERRKHWLLNNFVNWIIKYTKQTCACEYVHNINNIYQFSRKTAIIGVFRYSFQLKLYSHKQL